MFVVVDYTASYPDNVIWWKKAGVYYDGGDA